MFRIAGLQMSMHLLVTIVVCLLWLDTLAVVAQEPAAIPDAIASHSSADASATKPTENWINLFNGVDLTGWTYLPTTEQQKKSRANWQRNNPDAPPWPIVERPIDFAGQQKSIDGRFVAENGQLVVTVPAEGRKIQMLYTTREFDQDFTLKLEFRAATNADSGLFIRGKQLQCRDYPNAGPYKDLKKFNANDWNELVVTVQGTTAHCTCNGEILEDTWEVPASGPMGVEGDQGRLEYRNIRINFLNHSPK